MFGYCTNIVIVTRTFSILQSKRKHFFILLALCFFFYPIVPTIGYMINLCYMGGGQDHTSHKIEMFAKVRVLFRSARRRSFARSSARLRHISLHLKP